MAQEKQGFGAPLLALERCFSLSAPVCPSLSTHPGLKKTPGQNELGASGLLLHFACQLRVAQTENFWVKVNLCQPGQILTNSLNA